MGQSRDNARYFAAFARAIPWPFCGVWAGASGSADRPAVPKYLCLYDVRVDRGSPFPSNGLYLVTKKGVVVVDAPFDTTQFQPLVDSIRERHHQPVVLNIATHFHKDRTAALEFFRRRGVATYTTRLTAVYVIPGHQA